MSGKATISEEKSQPFKRNKKRKTDNADMDLSEEEIGITDKKNKSQPKCLSSKETGETSHTVLKQVKISSNKRRTWQPLSKSSREHIQTLIESIIIAILSKNVKEKEQIQYHLNCLKKRLLQQCESLNVPPKKVKYSTDKTGAVKVESVQHRSSLEGMLLLQEQIEKIEETVRSITEKIENLKNKIEILANEVEEEEEKIKQLHQRVYNESLRLPELSEESLNSPILQKEILALIPNQSAFLKDMNTLDNSSKIKSMLTVIEEAYKRLDAY